MDKTSIATLLLVTVLHLLSNTQAWDLADSCPRQQMSCFECNTDYDRNCGDPFDGTRPQSRYQANCYGGCCMKIIITRRDGMVSVKRQCTRDMSPQQIRNSLLEPYWSNSQESGIISICDTNLCNASNKQSTGNILWITISTILTAAFAFTF